MIQQFTYIVELRDPRTTTTADAIIIIIIIIFQILSFATSNSYIIFIHAHNMMLVAV